VTSVTLLTCRFPPSKGGFWGVKSERRLLGPGYLNGGRLESLLFEASPGLADGELLGQSPVKVWGFGVLPGNLDGKRVQELFPLVLAHLRILENVTNFI